MFQKQCKARKKCSTREFFRYAANYVGKLTACSEDTGLVKHDFEEDENQSEEEEINCAKKAKYYEEREQEDVQHEDIEYLDEEGEEGDIEYLDEEGEEGEYLEVEYLEDGDDV